MTIAHPDRFSLRGCKIAVLLAFGIWQTALGRAPAGPSAAVVAVQSHRVADLVMLDAGFAAGLRQGMVCRITRGAAEIAEVVLVELRSNHSAALILNVAPRQAIRAGDSAQIKILKS